MHGGVLNESVAFDVESGVDDGFGGKTIAWTEAHACRAQWMFASGDETPKGARNAGRNVYKLKIRSCEAARGLTTAHRMRDVRRSQSWNIINVDAITDRGWVYLSVEGPSDAS